MRSERFLVLGSWFGVLGSKFRVLGSEFGVGSMEQRAQLSSFGVRSAWFVVRGVGQRGIHNAQSMIAGAFHLVPLINMKI